MLPAHRIAVRSRYQPTGRVSCPSGVLERVAPPPPRHANRGFAAASVQPGEIDAAHCARICVSGREFSRISERAGFLAVAVAPTA